MKTIQCVILLLLSALLLAACAADPGTPSVPPETNELSGWQTYTSARFQFAIQYPPVWQVMELPTADYPTATDEVWLVGEALPMPQTCSRADIVLRFTAEDPSANWEEMYFNDYRSEALALGDIEARKVSGVNKESLGAETVVLAKIGHYYLQALPNQGEASLQYFDRVVATLRFVASDTAQPPPSVAALPETNEEQMIPLDGIGVNCPAWLAEGTAARRIPAYLDPSGFLYDDHPEYVRIDFVNPYTVQGSFAGLRSPWGPWSRHQDPERPELQPLILIIPTREYAEISPLAGERIEALRTLLEGSAPAEGAELPVLPTVNSAQDFRGQVAPLAFEGGRGLRFIARYSQETMPLVNPAVFYTFQGLTEDGSRYVAAFFPLYVSILPDKVQVEDWDAFSRGYRDYMAEIAAELQGLEPDDFEPNLEMLDALIRSLVIPRFPGDSDVTTPDASASGSSTSGDGDSFDCARVGQIPTLECEALVALYGSTGGPNWADSAGWLTSDAPCAWSGIECTRGHVSQIALLYNELEGLLPPELGNLSHLRVLSLWVNRLSGPIPAEVGNLSELIALDLSDNQLTGPLPAELGGLTKLRTLALAYNQFGGSIQPALGRLLSLQSLNLSHNQFSGAIPAELGRPVNLYQLDLSYNQLSGTIPAALGELRKLDELNLGYNQLQGPVPESIARISQRTLWGNQLEGTVATMDGALTEVDYEGVRFAADPSLAESIWPEVIPATAAPEGGPFWYAAPLHLRFTFADAHLPPGRLRMGINVAAEAQIFVFPVAGLAEINPNMQAQVEALQGLLAEGGPLPEGALPLLPLANAAQMFQAQARYVDLGDLRGIRFISQHAQDMRPASGKELFYTFQGITDDGAYYVAAFFPVTAAALADTMTREEWEIVVPNYSAYLAETTALLDGLLPADFQPDVALLDAVLMSLRVDPESSVFGEAATSASSSLDVPPAGLAQR